MGRLEVILPDSRLSADGRRDKDRWRARKEVLRPGSLFFSGGLIDALAFNRAKCISVPFSDS